MGGTHLLTYYNIQILNFVKKIEVSVSIFQKYDRIER